MKRLATQEKTLITEPTKKREIKAEIKKELHHIAAKMPFHLCLHSHTTLKYTIRQDG